MILGMDGTETFAGMLAGDQVGKIITALVLANGDKFHFRGNDALARVVHLADVHAGFGAARGAVQVEAHVRQGGIVQAIQAVSWSSDRADFQCRRVIRSREHGWRAAR